MLSFVTFYSATVPEHALLGSKVLEVESEDADRFEEVVVSIVMDPQHEAPPLHI